MKGNTDNAFVGDGYGAAVYSASYSAKAEEPDCSLMANLIAKSLSKRDNPDTKDFLRDTVNAMLRSVVVGATQACWFLLGLRYVRKSKAVISVNTLQKENMTMRLRTKPEMHAAVEAEGEEATAVDSSPGSNLGRRITYGDFVKNQVKIADVHNPESCEVTYSAFLSRYRLSRHKPSKEDDGKMCDGQEEVVEGAKDAGVGTEDDSSVLFASQKKPPEKKSSKFVWEELSVKLTTNDDGEIEDVTEARHFLIGNTRCTWMKNMVVINESPCIPFKPDDDRSVHNYSTQPKPARSLTCILPSTGLRFQLFSCIMRGRTAVKMRFCRVLRSTKRLHF
jgi:hypothetical protein